MKKLLFWIRQNPHALAWCYFIFYCIHFILLERFITPVIWIHHPLDELIPFDEKWIIFYLLWFPYFLGSLAYFMLKDKNAFLELCFFMFSTMSFCLLCQTLIPNGLDLRCEITSNSVFAKIVLLLQSVDTPTNVCPSIHVASSAAVGLMILKYKKFHHSILIKSLSSVLSVGICLSTLFLKQHSIIDFILGILTAGLFYFITYKTDWQKTIKKTALKKLFE